MGARTGKEYMERLQAHPPETWIGNDKVTNPVTNPYIAPAVKSIARLYDSQWEEHKRDYMLFRSPTSGDWVSSAFLIPRSKEDLMKRRRFHEDWAAKTYGMMGRSTDFMSAMLTAWYVNADFFGEYADNVRTYFEYVRENDLYLTHVLIDPQVNRGKPPSEQPDEFTYLGVVKETDRGLIVRGAKMLATAGPYADEMLVWPFNLRKPTKKDSKYMVAFAIPMNTPGVRLIAREPFVHHSVFDHPLAAQFDELDGVVIFDDVLVPWERVFINQDVERVGDIWKINQNAFTGIQTSVRLQTKLQFIAGIVMKVTEMVNTNQFPHIQDMIGEITTYIELIRSAVLASEASAERREDGIYLPNVTCLDPIRNSGNRWYPRVREIVQLIVAGGLMYQPADASIFDSEVKGDIEKYYRGAEASAEEKVKLLKLAADIAVSDFGSRHELYERFYAGDPMFLRINTQYKLYRNKDQAIQLVDDLLQSYDLNGLR